MGDTGAIPLDGWVEYEGEKYCPRCKEQAFR